MEANSINNLLTMIEITPINVASFCINFVKIRVELNLEDTTSRAFYWLMEEERIILSGDIEIPQQIHSQWGVDDSCISNYVLNELNLTKL